MEVGLERGIKHLNCLGEALSALSENEWEVSMTRLRSDHCPSWRCWDVAQSQLPPWWSGPCSEVWWRFGCHGGWCDGHSWTCALVQLWLAVVQAGHVTLYFLAVHGAPAGFMSSMESVAQNLVTHAMIVLWHGTLWILTYLLILSIKDLLPISQSVWDIYFILNSKLLAN
jgi:hypothetical protein